MPWSADTGRLLDPPAPGTLLLPSLRNPDTLMDLRPCALLLLWTLVVALTLLDQEVLAQHIYTNTWAVLVPAGPQEADRLARKHGFLNLGPVSLPPMLSFPCCQPGTGRCAWLCWE